MAIGETPESRMNGRREYKLDPEILGEAGGLFKSFLDDGARHGRISPFHGQVWIVRASFPRCFGCLLRCAVIV